MGDETIGRVARPRRVVVFACGELERGDDAVALRAAELIGGRGGGRSDVIAVGALEADHLMELGEAACVVADCVAGIEPGEIVVRPLPELLPGPDRDPPSARDRSSARDPEPAVAARSTVPGPAVAARSTHLLPLGDVLALADLLRPGLPAGSFVGIGGEDFRLGRSLSPSVERALPAFVEAIEREAARLAEAR
jgi:Ni,Fe-hydrogenase maturation factor